MEFSASLTDFIVYHMQFVDKDDQKLRLLSAQLDKETNHEETDKQLASVTFSHTSPENPSFNSDIYKSIENRANFHVAKLVVTLQLEALLSIVRFQDSLLKKLPKELLDDDGKNKEEDFKHQQQSKLPDEHRQISRSLSTTGKAMKKNGETKIFLENIYSIEQLS